MKVIVFGATGTVGKLAVEHLLKDGHQVSAFARRPDRIGMDHPALSLVAGDAMDRAQVSAAIQGHDAALVVLGAAASRRSRIRSQGTLNVIRGMQTHGVTRLIVQSTLGARVSWENLNFWWKRVMFGAVLAPVFRDHELQEQLVEASGLDWTIIRPGAFTDAPTKRPVIEDVPISARGLDLKITRADLAGFLSRVLGEHLYPRRVVGLSS